MYQLLHKTIETKPSNNLTYMGGLGKYNPLKSKKGLSNLCKIQKNTFNMIKD